MRSALYEGAVFHRRLLDPPHRIRLRGVWLYLDLAEWGHALRERWLWGVDRPALASVRARDHLRGTPGPLELAVRARVADHTGRRPTGRIGLLTMPRFAGVGFNPVSLFYCWDQAEEGLEAVLAEVTNTPWHERHVYVLSGDPSQGCLQAEVPKSFHVSPFLDMAMSHRFCIRPPGEQLQLEICNVRAGERLFDARLELRRREIGAGTLASALVRFPFQPLRVLASIYVHALRLHARKAPFHPHPASLQPRRGESTR